MFFFFLKKGETSECLQCYQCSSKTTDDLPLCDVDYWHALKQQHRDNFTKVCPNNSEAFCMKKVERELKHRYVERGCIDSTDSEGNQLTEGCLYTDKMELCACKQSLCNGSGLLPRYYVSWIFWTLMLGLL